MLPIDIKNSVETPAFLYDEAGIKNKIDSFRVKLSKSGCGVPCLWAVVAEYCFENVLDRTLSKTPGTG